jgi:putative glutamine amidotransferase
VTKKVIIGITDCEKYPNYEKWMLTERDVDVIRLSHQFSNLGDLAKCDGILLTGGEDVHPRFYGKGTQYPNAPEQFGEQRDEFEIQTFKRAQQRHLPVLGICRGLQLINCVFGGTLQQDLGGLNEVHKRVSWEDKNHEVSVEGTTLLFGITRVSHGGVNSSHHQAIDKLGNGLRVNCHAADGTIEGIEGLHSRDPFLLAVQWHPERMRDPNSPFSRNVKNAFLESAGKTNV